MTKAEYMREYRARHPGDAARRERNRRHGIKVTRQCKHCGKTFAVDTHHRNFCSKECQIAFNRIRNGCVPEVRVPEDRPCAWCGEMFTPRRPFQIYCKKACGKNASEKKRSAERRELRKHEVTCRWCGKTFVTESSVKVDCSNYCNDRFNKFHCSKAEYEAASSAYRTKVCAFCGKTFTAPIQRPDAKFCSAACHGAARYYESPEQRDRVRAERKAKEKANRTKDDFGLTAEQRQAVIDAQDGDLSLLWKLSKSWTQNQHKFAKARYEKMHGLFAVTFNG